ncbi:MAG: GH92 family glycosyl hydrolase [Bacteroidales bacterium]|nr:GH92 family glycosyl hydrolase [Bacteroidales bacterium]
MKRVLFAALAIVAALSGCDRRGPASWVDPFIGTDKNIHCYPNAVYPFGMLQPGPQGGNFDWNHCGGYHATDTVLIGFSQNRLSGSGGGGFGDVFFMPFSRHSDPLFASRFSDSASPGYYVADLPDNGVKVEVTVTERVAMYRISFDDPSSRKIYFNLQSFSDKRLPSRIPIDVPQNVGFPDDRTIKGSCVAAGWRNLHYLVSFDTPVGSVEEVRLDSLYAGPQYIVDFGSGRKQVEVKIAISAVDGKGAEENMATLPGWDFNKVKKEARATWNRVLGTVEAEGSPEELTKFYTAMYHSFIHPNLFSDVDGRFLGPDRKVYDAPRKHYTMMQFWDTFRSVHPMISLLLPEYAGPMAEGFLRYCEIGGAMPSSSSWGEIGGGMISDHAVPVVTDAYMKGLPGVTLERTYDAVRKTLTTPRRNREYDQLDRYGYFPNDQAEDESASKTLECSYDAWCAALLAKELGREEDYEYFRKRSESWKLLFDHSINFIRGRDSEGNWTTPLDPLYLCNSTHPGDYTEANAWQYTWHVLQDPEGLMEEMGGRDAYVAKLDSLFTLQPDDPDHWVGMDHRIFIGLHVPGNELSLHIPYMYTFAGRLDRTAEVVRKICREAYWAGPDGIPGNDDCGATSSWLFFSDLGFFPVNPASQEYILGAPQFPRAVLHLPGGDLEVVAENWSEENLYPQSVTLNGNPLKDRFTWYDIKDGGRLVFRMGPEPVQWSIPSVGSGDPLSDDNSLIVFYR